MLNFHMQDAKHCIGRSLAACAEVYDHTVERCFCGVMFTACIVKLVCCILHSKRGVITLHNNNNNNIP